MPDAPAPVASIADAFAAVAALASALTGGRLRKLTLVYEDDRGEQGTIPVPLATVVTATKPAPPLTVTQKAILRTLQEAKGSMTRKEVADALGHEDHKGRFGQAFAPMVDAGRIYEAAGEYADDPKKLDDTG